MGLFGKSKKEREKEYMNKLDVPSCLKENFELIIDDAFTIMGVGTVATGNILIGMCREGENACIYKANGDILESRITTVDVHTKERKANGCGFEAVKQSVTTRQAAEHFGIRVGRNGMCVCPFHADKNPSMKVDRRFHCFGCQADGDVIDFVSRLEAVSPKEAALILAQAFSVPYENREPPHRSQRNPRQETPEQRFRRIEVDGYKDFLFLNRDGLPKTAVNYDAMFKCLAKKYNKCHKEPLPDVMTPHTMRHTFCTRMANAGMNPKALQYIMGHANIVMTLNYYAHATFHSAQEEMERLQAKAKPTTEAKPEAVAESAEETKAA